MEPKFWAWGSGILLLWNIFSIATARDVFSKVMAWAGAGLMFFILLVSIREIYDERKKREVTH